MIRAFRRVISSAVIPASVRNRSAGPHIYGFRGIGMLYYFFVTPSP
jgi:hypothetical protein